MGEHRATWLGAMAGAPGTRIHGHIIGLDKKGATAAATPGMGEREWGVAM
jgi:hypothetical protein